MRDRIGPIAVAGVLVVAACASGRSAAHEPASASSSPAAGLVAWVDRPAPPYLAPTPTPPHFPTDARPCRVADLTASPGDVGAAGGTANIRIEFTNHSTTPCVLLGQPTVAGISADGTATDLTAQLGSIIGDAPWPAANIATGETAAVNVSAEDACAVAQQGGHRVFPTLRIGVPSGGFIDVASHGFDTVCGVRASRFGVPADASPPKEPRSPLTAQLTVPATARAGENLHFAITLRNRSDTTYELTPCPAYEEYLTTADGFVHPNYYLNCDSVQQIPAGAAVTYAMRMQLPTDLVPTAYAKFGWHLQGDAGPYTVTNLQITN